MMIMMMIMMMMMMMIMMIMIPGLASASCSRFGTRLMSGLPDTLPR